MSERLLWADTKESRRGERKRHVYEEVCPSSVDGTVYKRVCGSGNPNDPDTLRGNETLTRVSAGRLVADPELCQRCIGLAGLEHVKPKGPGAETVEYDPFGVFNDDS